MPPGGAGIPDSSDVFVGAVAFDTDGAVPVGLFEVFDAFCDVVGIDASADRHKARADAGLFPSASSRQFRADILDMGISQRLAEIPQLF